MLFSHRTATVKLKLVVVTKILRERQSIFAASLGLAYRSSVASKAVTFLCSFRFRFTVVTVGYAGNTQMTQTQFLCVRQTQKLPPPFL